MSGVRRPAAAGAFYPGDRNRLAREVDDLLADAGVSDDVPVGIAPEAVIVPHAGYVYSGPIAATAYRLVRDWAPGVRRVTLLGPAHFVPLSGLAVPEADAWETPLGEVAIDEELRAKAVDAGAVTDDGPHAPEHALEVQLPFLQRALGEGLSVLPVAVGFSAPGDVAALIEELRKEALVVVSSDLSHYHDEETTHALDRRTADAVLARVPERIGPEDACGAHALRGVLEHARRGDLDVRLLRLGTSADASGESWRVVGYGAFAMFRA